MGKHQLTFSRQYQEKEGCVQYWMNEIKQQAKWLSSIMHDKTHPVNRR
jgi:hypothetical protein